MEVCLMRASKWLDRLVTPNTHLELTLSLAWNYRSPHRPVCTAPSQAERVRENGKAGIYESPDSAICLCAGTVLCFAYGRSCGGEAES
jgi:hypothetical protein